MLRLIAVFTSAEISALVLFTLVLRPLNILMFAQFCAHIFSRVGTMCSRNYKIYSYITKNPEKKFVPKRKIRNFALRNKNGIITKLKKHR